MTEDNLTKHIGKKRKITTTVGSQAFHYTGIVIAISNSHITIKDEREGEVDIPISDSLIREVENGQ